MGFGTPNAAGSASGIGCSRPRMDARQLRQAEARIRMTAAQDSGMALNEIGSRIVRSGREKSELDRHATPMLPSQTTPDLLDGMWSRLQEADAVPGRLTRDIETNIGLAKLTESAAAFAGARGVVVDLLRPIDVDRT